ncbi:LamG domain-containing protein [Amycolatopsis sp. NPDC088138]|uniref:LamG domain-containing protein n=1 Tax=Amycolatopsis sp. NPDC088138 TaxID=3363938 RepID=UPI0038119ACD
MQVLACSFDESGDTVLDMTGNGNNFPLTSDATRVAGKTNGGIRPATTTAVPLPDVGQSDDRTVCMWIKGAIPDGWPVQWFDPLADSGAGAGVWGILFVGGDPIIRARNTVDAFTDATAAWPDTTDWHHVAGVFGGGSVKLYLDGVLADQQSLLGPIRQSDPPTLFGGWSGSGSFDDLRVYDSALGLSSVVAAMSPVASADLASAAALAVDEAFLARVTAAVQQYAVALAKSIRLNVDQSRKDEYVFAQKCLASPEMYGAQFGWALGSDLTVDPTIDDDTIRSLVQAAWPVLAKSL